MLKNGQVTSHSEEVMRKFSLQHYDYNMRNSPEYTLAASTAQVFCPTPRTEGLTMKTVTRSTPCQS